MRWPIGLLLFTLLSGCPSIDTGEDGGTGPVNVGPNGGLFIRAGYAIEIPRGAVAENTQINVTIVDTGIPEVPERKRISLGYRFSPSSLTFAVPVKLYLPWVAQRVPEAVTQDSFDMRRQAGTDAYLALSNAKTTMLGEVSFVEAVTERLGLFWLTSPSQPNIDRLEITPGSVSLSPGDTQQFGANIISPTGEMVPATVQWAVVPPRVGTVDKNGLFTAREPGIATVRAAAGDKSAEATANVFGMPVGPVSFVHENPLPTGNDLFGGGLIAGGFGTVFVGANGTVLGRSQSDVWSRYFSTPGVVFTGVAGTTAENSVAIGAQGTTGVLVQFRGLNAAPSVSAYRTVEPRHVWFDGTHGIAVGVGNDVLMYRARPDAGSGERSWQTEYSPSFEPLIDAVGDGQGSFITVGSRGSLYVWDPVRKLWDSLYQTQLATRLTAGVIASPDAGESWAVGGDKLWHFESPTRGWVAQNLPAVPSPGLAEATAIELVDHHLIIGARRNASQFIASPGLIMTYALDADAGVGSDGGWQLFSTRNPQVPRGVFGGGVDSTFGYVVGDFGSVYEWQSATKSFKELSSGFYGDIRDVAALPNNDVVATVNTCIDSACTARIGRVMHRAVDGGFELLGTQSFSTELFAIAATSAADVLVSAKNTSWHFDGAEWAFVPVDGIGQDGPILDFKLCGSAGVRGAGAGGSVYQGSTRVLDNVGQAAQVDLYAVWCPSIAETWVAGDGVMAVQFGMGKWVPQTSQSVNQRAWRAVWAPGGGEGFAFGEASYGIYWDTQTLKAVEPLPVRPDYVSALWGPTIDNLYAVGLTSQPLRFGFAFLFNGVTWQLIDSGSQRAVTSIDGLSTNLVWVGTEGGGLLRAVP